MCRYRYVGEMRVALVSTYELGHQPLHVASPAATLLRAGHEVRCMDLAVQPLDLDAIDWADAVACSVPMHTAFRLARAVCSLVRLRRPGLPLCLYGLYAPLDGAMGSPLSADFAIAGEYEPVLVSWVDRLAAPDAERPHLVVARDRGRFGLPARHLLPGLEAYARAQILGEQRLAGYVEASHGCAHRCRHCPVPVVYDGRTRLVGEDAVVADVGQLVALGARHVTFGDPDFLNGPHHAARIMAAVHNAFPDLTFDVTVKVEHILRHRELWPSMADSGCVFAVSAFESASDATLARLDKGHSVADAVEAVAVLRGARIEPRPSLLPFTPWTSGRDVFDLLDFVAACDLVGNIDAVQFAIRLLVPPGSLLLRSGALEGLTDDYDDEHLTWTWRSADSRLDDLQATLASVAERTALEGWDARPTYDTVRATAIEALADSGASRASAPRPERRLRSSIPVDDRPRLTEPWFCCAEPNARQLRAVGAEPATAPPPPADPAELETWAATP